MDLYHEKLARLGIAFAAAASLSTLVTWVMPRQIDWVCDHLGAAGELAYVSVAYLVAALTSGLGTHWVMGPVSLARANAHSLER